MPYTLYRNPFDWVRCWPQVVESHQRTKVDTSGTAKAIVQSFQNLGVDFNEVSHPAVPLNPESGIPRRFRERSCKIVRSQFIFMIAMEIHRIFQTSLLCVAITLQNQIERVRDKTRQLDMMGVPEDALSGHAFHTYSLTSPDGSVFFSFTHNVCGRNIYAEGTVDAALFLAKKVREGSEQRVFNMVDVLREGTMR